MFLVVASFVTEDAWLTDVGRYKEIHLVVRDLGRLDRTVRFGNAPVTWIVGSSITRDAFDADAIEARMRRAGSHHAVHKIAFNRGAPIFTQAIVDDLPLRPGDRVVTTIAEGNFQWGWLEDLTGIETYTELVLTPDELLPLADVSLGNRLEWSLASTPPAQFFKNQGNFRRGLVKTYKYWLGLSSRKPRPRKHKPYHPFRKESKTLQGRTSFWDVDPEAFRPGPGQTNWEGLNWLAEDLRARGVDLLVLYLPGHPHLYSEERVKPRTLDAMLDHFEAREDLRFRKLHPRNDTAYYDYKHPNNTGRPWFSRDLADLLLLDEGLQAPARPGPDPTLAVPGEVPPRLFDGVVP